MSLWKCLILKRNIKRYFWRVTILLFSDKLLEYWILHFCFVLSEFSPQSLQLSVLVSLPQQRGIRKLKWRTEKVTALLWKPGSFLLLTWHCHQAEAVFYQERRGERRSWTGAWAGVADRPVMSQIALSPGKLIHQTVTSDSVQGHYGKRRLAPVGAFWSVSL